MNIFSRIVAALNKWADPPVHIKYSVQERESQQQQKHTRIDPISPCCLQHMVEKHNPKTPDRIFVCPCRNEFRWAL